MSFDTKFRQLKRQHSFNSFHKLADLADKAANDPSEMWKRLKALSDRKSSHVLLETIRDDGSISKDKKEVLLKWYNDFSECFRGIKDDPDLVFDDDFLEQISKLKFDFDKLSAEEQMSSSPFDSSLLNADITLDEVSNAIDKSKLGKAFLFVPNEAMKNPQAKLLLQKLFNICFQTGLSPADWLAAHVSIIFSSQPSHPPGVPVLVPDLLLNFRISEGLQERTPDVCLALVPDAWDVASSILSALCTT